MGVSSRYNLNRAKGYEDRRYYLAHYIQEQETISGVPLDDLDALGLIDQAGKVDFDALSDFDALKRVGDDGRGVGGYIKAQRPPGVYTCVDTCMLKKIKQFVEIPLTIWVIVSLRRLYNEPIDVMLGLEYLPSIPGGFKTIRNLHRKSIGEVAKETDLSLPLLYKFEKFSSWAYDNKAGKIETPTSWILEQLDKNRFPWEVLLKIRNIFETNIDDLLGMCYNE